MPPYHSSNDVLVYIEGSRVLRRRGTRTAAELVRLDNGFSATDVALNKSGSLLAVAARKALHIWIIEGELPARRLRVEGLRFDDYIRGIAWHPCAREDACLVVLTEHAVISIYCPPGETPVVETTRLLDAENIDLDAVGLSFGSLDAPAGPVTLYVATKEGDIYGICPFVPPEIELPKSRLSSIRDFASLGSWPVELDNWSPKYGEVTILKRPARAELSVHISTDPLKLVPYPEELYDEEVLDLAVGSLGSSWASDLVVQTTTHFVNFFLSGFPLNKELVLVSCVKFSQPQKVRKVRIVTPKIIVIDTQRESHVLDIGDWIKEISQIRHKHALEPKSMLAVPGNLPPTQVEGIALSYAYCTPRSVETVPVSFAAPSKSWSLRQTNDDNLADSLQNLSLDTSSFVRPTKAQWNSSIQMDVGPSRSPTTTLSSNLAALYDLDDISLSYETKISNLFKALVEVQFDRQTQEKELLAQLEQATAISRKLESVNSKSEELRTSVAAAKKRQDQLNERIRKAASSVATFEEKKVAERPLCAAEEKWFDELRTQLSQKTGKAQSQFSALQSSVSALERLRDSQQESNRTYHKLTPAQIRNIKGRLQRQESLIMSLKEGLDQ